MAIPRRSAPCGLVAAALLLTACGGDDPEQTQLPSAGSAPITIPAPTQEQSPGSGTPDTSATGGTAAGSGTSTTSNGTPTQTEATVSSLPGGAQRNVFVADEAEVELEDQVGDGATVIVEEASLRPGPGLVVIFAEGSAAPLGVENVPSAGAQSLAVALQSPLSEPTRIRAVLYADTDEDGSFDPTVDAVVVDDDGEPEGDDAEYSLVPD